MIRRRAYGADVRVELRIGASRSEEHLNAQNNFNEADLL